MDHLPCAAMRKSGKRAELRPQRCDGRITLRQTLGSVLRDLSNRNSSAGGWKRARFNFVPTACCLPLWRRALRCTERHNWHRPLRCPVRSAFSNAPQLRYMCLGSQSVKLSRSDRPPVQRKSRPRLCTRPVRIVLRCRNSASVRVRTRSQDLPGHLQSVPIGVPRSEDDRTIFYGLIGWLGKCSRFPQLATDHKTELTPRHYDCQIGRHTDARMACIGRISRLIRGPGAWPWFGSR